MKLSVLLLTTGALAATLDTRNSLLVARQSALIDDIQAINNAVKAADSDINSGDYTKLATDFNTILDTLDKAKAAADSSLMLEQEQALVLAEPASALSKQSVKTLQDISSKKSDIVKANLGGAVYAGLQKVQAKATDFIDVLTHKIPASLSTVAAGIVQPTVEQLKKTINDFKDVSGSGSPSKEASPSSTVAAPATSTPVKTETTSAPTAKAPAETSASSTPAVYGPPPSTNTTTTAVNTTLRTPTSAATPESYTGAAATVFAMGPAALAAAAVAAVAAL